jgi:hypothetical protein
MTLENLLFEVNYAVAGSNNKYHRRLPQMHGPQDDGDPEQATEHPQDKCSVSVGLAMCNAHRHGLYSVTPIDLVYTQRGPTCKIM